MFLWKKIATNLDGVYVSNDIDGWQKLMETIDKINSKTINSHSLTRGADEIAFGKQVQFENGNADLEIFNPLPPESYQLKQISSVNESGVQSNIELADIQLSGANGEVPTAGHTKIAEVKLTSSSNPLYNLGEYDLLTKLQAMKLNITTAEKVVVQNGVDRFIFNASQL